ncbi:hypothetical protein FACS1894208_00550 [Clostridia bacterium]|nr:hypothetical protein FACS1894208_00550 [Clostridia bacterium]
MFEKTKDKLRMYDGMLANFVARGAIVEPDAEISTQQIHIGFSAVSSATRVFKYFVIRKYGDYVQPALFDEIRRLCSVRRVRIDFSEYVQPHSIDWASPEMKNRMKIWTDFTSEDSDVSAFSYRQNRDEQLRKERIVRSTKYLNESELDHRRAFAKMFVVMTVSGERADSGLTDLEDAIKNIKTYCGAEEITLRELKVNLVEWLTTLAPTSLLPNPQIDKRTSRKIVTDDIISHLGAFRQGVVGYKGISLGVDVLARVPVLRKFKEDPDKAETMLICAETGGGKSYYVKTLLTYLLAENICVSVLDYEGDEYTNLFRFIHEANPADAALISFGKGGSEYFDPLQFPDLTGDEEVDCDIKEAAVSFTLAMFNVIVGGADGTMTDLERRVVSEAIGRVFDSIGVTDNRETWKNTKLSGITIADVYDEVKTMVGRREFSGLDDGGNKAAAALHIMECGSLYFEEGEARYGSFAKPLSADALFRAKFVVFSFGAKGQAASTQDKDILALRQLGVAYINTAISNYCKSVLKTYHACVWEELQRWGEIRGAAEIIANSVTGGRKRGELHFIITTDLNSILDQSNVLNARLRQNIQNFAIGKVRDKDVRKEFCRLFDLRECEGILNQIAKATGDNLGFNYVKSFCVILDNGKKAVTKVMLPPAIAKSKLFRTGVDRVES